MAVFQLIVTAVTFSKAKPFRKSIYQNTPFLTMVIILTTFGLYLIVFNEHTWLSSFF